MHWILVNPVDDVDTVVNVIVADQEFIDNLEGYEFKLEQDLYDPAPGVGWTYDSGNDTFSAPPIDYDADFIEAMQELVEKLQGCIEARSFLSNSGQADTDINEIDTDNLDSDALTNLWPTISDYIKNYGN